MRAQTTHLMLALATLVACNDAGVPNATPSLAGAGAGGVATAGAAQTMPTGGAGVSGSGLGGMPQAGTAAAGAAGTGGTAAETGGATTGTGGQPDDLLGAAAGLHGFRWEIACGAAVGDWSCVDLSAGVQSCPAAGTQFADKTVTIGGPPGQLLTVELQFRGIMEPNVYSGGTSDGDGFYVGGGGGGHRDIAAIHVSAPEQVYYLNSVPSTEGPHYALEIDYVKKIEVSAGATIHLTGGDLDCITDKNCKQGADPCEPIVVPEVPPYPASFDGNFIQMDVLSVF